MYDMSDGNQAATVPSGDKRRYARFPTQLRALYYLSDEQEGLEKCDIINVSYGGLGIALKTNGALKDLSTINLGIVVKWQFMPVSLKGMVKWLDAGVDELVGGVEFAVPLDNITLLKLL